jgi:hypothetical protein
VDLSAHAVAGIDVAETERGPPFSADVMLSPPTEPGFHKAIRQAAVLRFLENGCRPREIAEAILSTHGFGYGRAS